MVKRGCDVRAFVIAAASHPVVGLPIAEKPRLSSLIRTLPMS